MKILVIEDDLISRAMMVGMFTKHICNVATNGQTGLEMFVAAHENKEPYDLACIDIMMPVMDGQKVLRLLREHEEKIGIEGKDRCKIIMATALDDGDNVCKAFAEMCDGYLVKPISRTKLAAEIARVFGK